MGYSSVRERILGNALIWESSREKFPKKKEKILWKQKITAIFLWGKKIQAFKNVPKWECFPQHSNSSVSLICQEAHE